VSVVLLRHGETAWDLVNAHGWPGAANDLAPLTARGARQAEEAAERLAVLDVARVLSSPMTRALQTAAVVGSRLGRPPQVELDLREWCPDLSWSWTTEREVLAAYDDFLAHAGTRPDDHDLRWESLAEVRERALRVLGPYAAGGELVVAVCHEVLIHALTGEQRTALATTRDLPARPSSAGQSGSAPSR